MPQSLCPYFWKLLGMWILILPTAIWSIPSMTYLAISKENNEVDEWGGRIITNLILWLALFFGGAMLFSLSWFFVGFFSEKSLWYNYQLAGILSWLIGLIIGIIFLIVSSIIKRKERIRRKHNEYIWNEDGDYVRNPDYVPYEPKPNLIVEFIKAKYNKYCPKIDWK
jgi:hypothetical protein